MTVGSPRGNIPPPVVIPEGGIGNMVLVFAVVFEKVNHIPDSNARG